MQNGFIQEDFKVIQLGNGYQIEITTSTIEIARSGTVTKSVESVCRNSKGEELCSYILFGDFNRTTGQCVNSYHTISTSNSNWSVEDADSWNDSNHAYGYCNFVQRILGIKTKTLPQNLQI